MQPYVLAQFLLKANTICFIRILNTVLNLDHGIFLPVSGQQLITPTIFHLISWKKYRMLKIHI